MDPWDEAKNKYEKIEIPKELNLRIQNEIQKDRENQKKKRKVFVFTKSFAATAAAFIIILTGTVNSSSSIAMAMYSVPVLGDIARVVTFREYKYSDNLLDLDVTVPKIENTGNTELEERINTEIEKKLLLLTEEMKKSSEERKEAAAAEGYNEEELYQASFSTSYEQKFCDGEKLSFIITRFESAGSSDSEMYCYNVDLNSGADITLKDLLGENYKEIVNASIAEQIKERMASDENQIFFGTTEEDKELEIEGFTGIEDNQKFYLNADGNVVVVFDKYEIAPGYMGMPEFEIVTKK